MSKVTINSYAEFEKYIGKDIGVSDFQKISQEQINMFAEATNDHQWIHVDPQRAAIESPFGTTIAHGYLTVSLLAQHWVNLVQVNNVKLQVNYGIDKLKFGQAVKVNDEVCVKVKLISLVDLRGIVKAQLGVRMEIKDQRKPVFQAVITFLYHFE